MNNMQVHEIAAHCEQLPERYIAYKEDQEYGVNVTSADIPVIDFSLLTSSPSELNKFKSALTTWGCFQAINHGIDGSFLEKVRETSKLFFKLPADEKKKYLREEHDIEGYGNDMVFSDNQTLDWNDRLHLTILPRDQQKLHFWPHNPTHFREILDAYGSKIQSVNEVVLKALARSLSLDEDCFLNQCGTISKIRTRLNYYPPCAWPERVLGSKPHTDGSAITFLLQDKEVEGLQILKNDQWVRVPIVPDALTINVGDQIEIMSNGIFKSVMHRVCVNSKNERMTVAMFSMPQTEMEIGPVDALITDETPRLYNNITYDHDTFFKILQQGRRMILSLCQQFLLKV